MSTVDGNGGENGFIGDAIGDDVGDAIGDDIGDVVGDDASDGIGVIGVIIMFLTQLINLLF